MRNMLAFLAAAILTLAGVGWYFDWYNIVTKPGPDGRRSVTLDIDTRKIGEDLSKANQEIQRKLAEKNQTATQAGHAAPGHSDAGTAPAKVIEPARAFDGGFEKR